MKISSLKKQTEEQKSQSETPEESSMGGKGMVVEELHFVLSYFTWSAAKKMIRSY